LLTVAIVIVPAMMAKYLAGPPVMAQEEADWDVARELRVAPSPRLEPFGTEERAVGPANAKRVLYTGGAFDVKAITGDNKGKTLCYV
jgi:hypothetical protein